MAALALCGLTPGPATAGPAGTALTADGYGVLAGSPDAPVQLEIFCEPQCPQCAQFEAASDTALTNHLGSGRLAVTYRWLTFLDGKHDNDASARMSTALMAAADPATAPTAYQALVAELYRHQGGDGPTTGELAGMATGAGLPGWVVTRIAIGLPSVDTVAMDAANRELLNRENPDNPSTPTVYNLKTHTVVDTQDSDWLDKLIASG